MYKNTGYNLTVKMAGPLDPYRIFSVFIFIYVCIFTDVNHILYALNI